MGEEFTGGFYKGNKNKIKCIKKFQLPNTLGGFYSTFTEFFGFKSNTVFNFLRHSFLKFLKLKI